LTRLGEDFFLLAKMPSNKNKSLSDFSPYAGEFFRIFLGSEGKFMKPEASAFYRPYNLEIDELASWDANL
jgi:hypothetical protein